MKDSLQINVAIIGGDSRQIAVADALVGYGAKVKLFGHSQENLSGKLTVCQELSEVLSGVKAVILPISGINDAGIVRGSQMDQMIDFGSYFDTLPEETLLITGSLTPKWEKIAAEKKFIVYQYAEDDTVAILNSIPTAEGAVQIAMEKLPITIHGSNVLVIGFGRVGVTVARIFKALGAQVTVAARRSELLARAQEMGCLTVHHQLLSTVFPEVDIIINTIPVMVIDEKLLTLMSSESLIIDLASPPGGTDFESAQKLKKNAILAPGLPGKVAPKTAGTILASAIPRMMAKILENGGGH